MWRIRLTKHFLAVELCIVGIKSTPLIRNHSMASPWPMPTPFFVRAQVISVALKWHLPISWPHRRRWWWNHRMNRECNRPSLAACSMKILVKHFIEHRRWIPCRTITAVGRWETAIRISPKSRSTKCVTTRSVSREGERPGHLACPLVTKLGK